MCYIEMNRDVECIHLNISDAVEYSMVRFNREYLQYHIGMNEKYSGPNNSIPDKRPYSGLLLGYFS